MIKYLGSPNGLITANQIADGSILGADITANTIANTKLVVGTITGTEIASNTIANLKIADTAAIVYSKLTLANSVVNSDININAGIVNTKLASGTLTNTEINASAAIVGSKLADASIANGKLVAGTLTNTEISGTANIVLSKLATISAGQVVLGNSAGVPTNTALTGHVLVDSGGATTINTAVIVNTHISTTAAIAYSKLSLSSSIVNGDIAPATISNTKLVAGTLTNAEISGSAAISPLKLSGYGANFTQSSLVVGIGANTQFSSLSVTSVGGATGGGGGGLTAPVAGLYSFSLSISSPNGGTGYGLQAACVVRTDSTAGAYAFQTGATVTTNKINVGGTLWLTTSGTVTFFVNNLTGVAATVNAEAFVRLVSN